MKEFDIGMHCFVDIVLVGCMMCNFCHALHSKGGVPSEVLTRSNKSTSACCKNNVAELFR
jgi:hypothetical protein